MDDAEGSLCQTCITALCDGESNLGGSIKAHHRDYTDFKASKADCFICAWLWAQHRHPPTTLQDSTSDHHFEISCKTKGRGWEKSMRSLEASFRVTSSWAAEYELRVFLGSESKLDSHPRHWMSNLLNELNTRPWSKLDSRLGSAQDLQTIETWLSHCEDQHEHCYPQSRRTSSFFPTRVIDVQDANNGFVRLQRARDVSLDAGGYPPVYWTLSHRWGNAQNIMKLTKTTERHFYTSISMNDLPPTFRDAALLVQRLGFRYLWIDSLCIFQDSFSDWHQETQDMVNIYRNTYCNISAAGSSHDPSNEGLFQKRGWDARLLYPFIIKAGFQPYGEESHDNRWVCWNDSTWDDEIEKTSLATRGWVVQERFLGTRIIHFAQNQIFWECLGSIRCAADPNSTLMTVGTKNRRCAHTTRYKSSRLEVECYRAKPKKAGPEEPESRFISSLYRQWQAIASVYASSNLTKESDRFIALSGIAKTFRELGNDAYLAGLWKRTLPIDLTWTSGASQGNLTRRSASYAPSWSWASIVGAQVNIAPDPNDNNYYDRFRSWELIKLLKERRITDPPGGDLAGSLQSAELDITCIPYYYRWEVQSKKLSLYDDEQRAVRRPDLDGEKRRNVWKKLLTKFCLDTSDLVDRLIEVGEMEGMCIPVFGLYTKGIVYRDYLILEHDGDNRYKRIGLLRAECTQKNVSTYDKHRSIPITLI
ncbi:heterokaryon incompatibility protein-domain-containing protein [Xylaria arbuscula]|nr:heterokaryon incompatibility protein-domain-containing protein [Xylaria arbuscula]